MWNDLYIKPTKPGFYYVEWNEGNRSFIWFERGCFFDWMWQNRNAWIKKWWSGENLPEIQKF